MRYYSFLFALLAWVSFAAASADTRWNSASVDTVTHTTGRNTSSGKVGVGVDVTGPSGVGVGVKVTGSNAFGVKVEATGTDATGILAEAPYVAVSAQATGATGLGLYAFGAGTGVSALGKLGVWGGPNVPGGIGVRGWSYHSSDTGVYGESYYGTAVVAKSTEGGALKAEAPNSLAIWASGVSGVEGYSSGIYSSGVYGNGAIGVSGTSYGTGGASDALGVSAYAYNSNSTTTYGLNAQAVYGDYTYGVYASAVGGNYANWAGYFDGDVYVGGYFDNPSDIMFKKNVRPMQGGLAKVMALKPKNYDMKVDEFKDRIHLPKGNQYGLIAQELETVLPELVHATAAPAKLTPEERKKGVKKEPTKFKSVNYVALIPILVQAIQEQQAEIEALKRQVAR